MKYLIYLTTIVSTAIAVIAPTAVKAQVVDRGFPPDGYTSTTIYVPSTQVTTTTTTIVTPIGTNSNYSSINTFTRQNGFGDRRGFSRQRHRQFSRPTRLIQQYNVYPTAIESRCSTEIIGSPIPSIYPIDRYTGQPCR